MRSTPVAKNWFAGTTLLSVAALALFSMASWTGASGQSSSAKPPTAKTAGNGSENGPFIFRHDRVLGTSMELAVATRDRAAGQACEKAVLEEIERLAGILSTYEPNSEISKLNASGKSAKCSPELIEVLAAAQSWQERSGGAFNIQVAAMTDLWRQAEKTGRPPAEQQLAAIAKQIGKPAFELDAKSSQARRVSDQPIAVDALAKGYIIEKAVAAGRKACPEASGILLDIGGDQFAWGSSSIAEKHPWVTGVADPRHNQDNAPPLVRVHLNNQGIATSGPYARGFDIAKKHYSHIIDSRTGQPVQAVGSATVVAPDAMTADAMATCLNVLSPTEGLKLTAGIRGAECLIVTADGTQHRSPGWSAIEETPSAASRPTAAGNDKAVKKEVIIDLQLIRTGRGRYMKPYVAIWIEDADGKPVATVAVWGHEREYQKTLTTWWKFAKKNTGLIESISRATRPAGKYSLSWNLADDKGKRVAPGTYTVCIEVNREKGGHVNMRGNIDCQDKQTSTTITGNGEVADVTITYGRSADDK